MEKKKWVDPEIEVTTVESGWDDSGPYEAPFYYTNS